MRCGGEAGEVRGAGLGERQAPREPGESMPSWTVTLRKDSLTKQPRPRRGALPNLNRQVCPRS